MRSCTKRPWLEHAACPMFNTPVGLSGKPRCRQSRGRDASHKPGKSAATVLEEAQKHDRTGEPRAIAPYSQGSVLWSLSLLQPPQLLYHSPTIDPLAVTLLCVCAGRAARRPNLLPFMPQRFKRFIGEESR